MTRRQKRMCDGENCGRVYKVGSLLKWQGEFLCYRCRIKRWSWVIMNRRAWATKEDKDDLEGRDER